MRTLAILLIALVATAAVASAKGPVFREGEDNLVLTNDAITVWFDNRTPSLTVMKATDLAGALAYDYRYTDVVEYRDLDGNGAPSDAEVVARLDFTDANWTTQQTQTDERASLNYTLEAPVELGLLAAQNVSLSETPAIVSLVFTLGAPNATDGTLAVELVVAQWPFVNAQNRLALGSLASGVVELDEGDNATTAMLTGNETALGNVTWASVAQGVGANGTAVDVPVVPAVALAGANESRVILTYDAADLASLVHASWLDVPAPAAAAESTREPLSVPGIGSLAGLAALGAAAWAMRRK